MSIFGYTLNFSIPLSNFDTPLWHEEDYARWRIVDGLLGSIDDALIPFAIATGAVNAFVVTYSPAITAYTSGLIISFQANIMPTGAATVNVNGLGAKNIKFNGVNLQLNDIPAGTFVKLLYNGTEFLVLEPIKAVNSSRNITTGSSGATANSETDFYVESAGPTYVELLGPDASTQGFMFSRPTATYAGGVIYDHVNEILQFQVGQNAAASVDDAGNFTSTSFTGSFTGPLVGNATSASTATKLTNGRTISFTGNVTGVTASFDGTGDVSAALTIADGAVTLVKMQDVTTDVFLGRTTAGTGIIELLTPTQATELLNSFSGTIKGLVPAPGAGLAALRRVLLADGTWTSPFAAYATITGATGASPNSFNIASVVRSTPGTYAVTFAVTMPNNNYIITGGVKADGIPVNECVSIFFSSKATGGFAISVRKLDDTPNIDVFDPDEVYFSVIV